MAASAKGNVTWCIGKDTTGAFSQVVKLYNAAHPSVHVTLLELPTSADQQRTQLVQREQAKSSECDILGMDVIWTPEFAGQGWLRDTITLPLIVLVVIFQKRIVAGLTAGAVKG